MVTVVRSKEQYNSVMKGAGTKLVVIDFYAEWCGPCKKIQPQYEELSKVHKDVLFLSVDVDEAQDLVQECEIKAMPTFIFMKGGERVRYNLVFL
uniref:Thioredoxin domain-containing protein n=1 Tax=Latimeria chalumnae TaxID=7897 RepID=M3XI97_LATCH